MRSLLPSAILLFAALPLAGCCSFARYFCGPDRTPWISVSFASPRAATRTFLEALRRDDPEIVYLCLSDSYRDGLEIDSMTTKAAWPVIREQMPGLHLAGYAEVPEPTRHGRDRASVEIDVEGYKIAIELFRESYFEVRYLREGQGAAEGERFGPDGKYGKTLRSFTGRLVTTPIGEDDPDFNEERFESRIRIDPLVFEHDGLDAVPVENIDAVGYYREWKIAGLRQRQ
ncbi:MAG: hypothetical protein AB8H80_12950 [Planctomycetota bacterium]